MKTVYYIEEIFSEGQKDYVDPAYMDWGPYELRTEANEVKKRLAESVCRPGSEEPRYRIVKVSF